jgi:hypothetical protein
MLPKRRRRATLDDVVELLHGIGVMMQKVDARLEDIVELLEGIDGET